MTTAEIEAPSFELQLLTQALNQTEKQEQIVADYCIKAVQRANRLTGEMLRYRQAYYRAAGFPFQMER